MSEPKLQDKPFQISKWKVWEAFERVRANKGAAGVDEQSIAEFEADRDRNLYKIWNRMSSGSYFPPPVKAVEIPKAGGTGVRVLGVPTVAGRIAQTVARLYLEPQVEPMFHPDSYGYRPGRSALDAVAVCRQRCWRADWVIDMDIRAFFDTVPWDLVLKAVTRHISPGQQWIVLYVQRWLEAPLQKADGTLVTRDRGTPQGSAISPLIANLFMHYAFDAWMAREVPGVRFERYCDDAVVHCASEQQARHVRDAIAGRLAEVGLELHPQKTKIVYCKDADRTGSHEHEKFTFLGYEFRPRLARNRNGKHFVSFLPAVSTEAMKAMGREIRSWHLGQAQRQVPRRPCADVQQRRARVDQLLRALLPLPVALLTARFVGATMLWPQNDYSVTLRLARHSRIQLADIPAAEWSLSSLYQATHSAVATVTCPASCHGPS